MEFDEDETGEDFDGDGHPEVVFTTDVACGNRCTTTYHVVSLYPKPHLLVDIPQSGQVDFSKDKNGRMLISLRRFIYGVTSNAVRATAIEMYVVEEGKLKDVTLQHCQQIEAEGDYRLGRESLTPDAYKKFNDNQLSGDDDESFISKLLSVALQQTVCEQYDQAIETLAKVNQPKRGELQKALAESVGDHPLFAKRLHTTHNSRSLK